MLVLIRQAGGLNCDGISEWLETVPVVVINAPYLEDGMANAEQDACEPEAVRQLVIFRGALGGKNDESDGVGLLMHVGPALRQKSEIKAPRYRC